jgi:hypothetical protein
VSAEKAGCSELLARVPAIERRLPGYIPVRNEATGKMGRIGDITAFVLEMQIENALGEEFKRKMRESSSIAKITNALKPAVNLESPRNAGKIIISSFPDRNLEIGELAVPVKVELPSVVKDCLLQTIETDGLALANLPQKGDRYFLVRVDGQWKKAGEVAGKTVNAIAMVEDPQDKSHQVRPNVYIWATNEAFDRK